MITHIAGPDITIDGRYLRQRCAWCGDVLLEYDLERVAVPVGQTGPPVTWPLGSLVSIDGPAMVAMGNVNRLPDDACSRNPLTLPGF